MKTSSPNALCQSLDVRKEQSIVLQKELMPGYHISVRPVSVYADNDIHAIYEWLSVGAGSKAGLPVEQLRVLFILMGESTYAQAFMVLLNDDIRIGQLEVYQVLQDELKDAIDAGEGDYRIYVPVMPVIESLPEVSIHVLQTCLHYFFSCSEVHRLFWVIPENDKERNKLAANMGGVPYKIAGQATIDGQPANVYLYARLGHII